MENLVNRLTFEIDCESEDQALTLRQNISQSVRTQLEEGIDRICSRHTLSTETIRITKLQLDLGQFNPYTLDRHLVNAFLEKFEQALLLELQAMPSYERENSTARAQVDALLHFLETGQQLWKASISLSDLNRFFLLYLERPQPDLVNFLSQMASNPAIWQRIAHQFSQEVHEKLVSQIADLNEAAHWIIRWVNEISEILGLDSPASTQALVYKLVIGKRTQLVGITNLPKHSLQLFMSHVEYLFQAMETSEQQLIERIAQALVKEVAKANGNGAGIHNKMSEALEPRSQTYTSEHGGAVLLAQFLSPLFKNLGLYKDGEWTASSSPQKAVHLINYMCTGRVQAPEYELNIEKLLCGLPLNAPIPLDANLTASEIQESDHVLASILEHWKALNKTSIDGLRQTFLLRECLLTPKDTHWLIHLDRTTVDVLLDQLPWGFSIIIMPWNGYQINVEW